MRVPPEAGHEARVELERERQAINIVELRPRWRDDHGPEWSRLPVARLRYVASTGLWTLYYHRHTGRWCSCSGDMRSTHRVVADWQNELHGCTDEGRINAHGGRNRRLASASRAHMCVRFFTHGRGTRELSLHELA